MLRRFDFRAALIAVGFFAIGFLVADRMTRVEAAPLPSMQDNGQAFSGNDGAVVMKVNGVPNLIIVRGAKLWRVDPSSRGHNASFATVGE
jgi:hypothetical protein